MTADAHIAGRTPEDLLAKLVRSVPVPGTAPAPAASSAPGLYRTR